MAKQTPSKQLFDLLVTKNFNPECLDFSGKAAANPEEADVFSFDYTGESGKDYGTVVLMLDNTLTLYSGDNTGKAIENVEDRNGWFDFLYQLKNWAVRNLPEGFSMQNLNQLKYSMQSRASSVNESIFESWTGTKTTSWNGRPTEARLMIRHKRPIGENDARFRYVESLFIETAEGERYKLPFTKLSGGRAMVEHVKQGGRPYDARGLHITEMVTELNVLSRFRRANHGRVFEGDTAQLVEQTNAYYESLQKTLKGMSHGRGYAAYFETWNPDIITEEEAVVEGLKHLFVTQSLDSRIEDALPLLARIQQQGQAMKEANIFEAWANSLMEGTWATPNTPEKRNQLVALLSKEFPVGPDATNATEQLYDLIGDDELFDQLEALAETNPDADCRQVVMDRMDMLSNHPDIQAVIELVQVEPAATMNPAPEVDVTDTEVQDNEELGEVKDPATQTEDPAGTEQPAYPEYQDDLESILKIAGVPAEQRPAPDYEDEICEAEGKKLNLDDFTDANGDVDWGAYMDAQVEINKTEYPAHVAKVRAKQAKAEPGIGDEIKDMNFGDKKSLNFKDFMKEEESDELDEGATCNMTESGESCPVHGMEECWGSEKTALQGQYGHSGKLKPVSEDTGFLDRLKELSGMMRSDKI